MRRFLTTLLVLITCFIVTSGAGRAAPLEVIKRFAIIVGSNNGGADRVRLRYAVSDARSFMSVFRKLGGVEDDGSMLLVEPAKDRLISSLAEMREKVIRAKKAYRRVELIFYYSGHSDEEGLLLAGDKIYYRDIKHTILAMPADVRIAILDSCSSGAFTSIKGGKMRSPFLVDRSQAMRGFAFMTSSSSDEASQESDRIGGSFFTHYLVTGLRGAADLVGDGRITLSEAYQFAYTETLARTEKTLRGPQHPNYNIMMSGAGDVVLTDVRKSSSSLVLSRPIAGKIFLRNQKKVLVAELNKSGGRPVMLGLESGKYSVLNERDGKLFEAAVQLLEGSSFTLSNNSFTAVDREYTRGRGDDTGDGKDAAGEDSSRDDASAEAVHLRGFADSIVRISLYVGLGLPQGGIPDKERRHFNMYRTDLSLAYLKLNRYDMYTGFIHGGPEADIMLPAKKIEQKRKFDLTGIKFGFRFRYGYEMLQNMIIASNNSNMNFSNNLFNGKLMEYQYWGAGPVVNFIFTPRRKPFDVILNIYALGGHIFDGRVSGGASLRSATLLWLRMGGIVGTPVVNLDQSLVLLQSGRFNSTRIRGYTIRFGAGPEISLNRWIPLIVGLHLTYAYTNLTMNRALPLYLDGRTRAWHHEYGAEISMGMHF